MTIGAIAISYGPSLQFALAVRTGQVAPVRALSSATPLAIWIPILYVVGGVLGRLTAINFNYNLLAPWLVIAYVLWVVAMVLGGAIHAPFYVRVAAAAKAAPDGPIGGELAAVIADPRERYAAVVDYVVVVALIFDMVVKPFS